MNNAAQTTGTESNQQPGATPKATKGMSKILIIGGSAFGAVLLLVVALVAVNILLPKSLSLSKIEAEKALMEPSDFAFDLSDADEPKTIMEDLAWVVFDAGASECSEDGYIQSTVQDQGTLLASTDLNGTDLYFSEDIVEFESAQTATDIVNLVNSGYYNTACDYDSDTVSTTFSDLGTTKEKLGLGPESSAYFAEDSDWSLTDYDFLSSKTATLAVADGRYLVIMRMSAYSDALSLSSANVVLTDALKKLYK